MEITEIFNGIVFSFQVTDNGRRLRMAMYKVGHKDRYTAVEFSRDTTQQIKMGLHCKELERILEKKSKKET